MERNKGGGPETAAILAWTHFTEIESNLHID